MNAYLLDDVDDVGKFFIFNIKPIKNDLLFNSNYITLFYVFVV